jgi:hypothetical protein
MDIMKADTAVVVIDPQNDVLSETGVSWPLVGDSVRENHTVENLERLFRAAKQHGYGVFVSPHDPYPHAQGWRFGGPVEHMMLDGKAFFHHRGRGRPAGPVQSVHRGRSEGGGEPAQGVGQSSDMVSRRRKRRVSRVLLAGMLANLSESHLRELVEQGFEAAPVTRISPVGRGAYPYINTPPLTPILPPG